MPGNIQQIPTVPTFPAVNSTTRSYPGSDLLVAPLVDAQMQMQPAGLPLSAPPALPTPAPTAANTELPAPAPAAPTPAPAAPRAEKKASRRHADKENNENKENATPPSQQT